jgi:hypothetical protein
MRERSRPTEPERPAAAVALQDELRAAVRQQALPVYRNKYDDDLKHELVVVDRDRVRPIPADDYSRLANYANRGEELKWVLSKDGELLLGRTQYTHPTLVRGEGVLAAGHISIVEDRRKKELLVLDLRNESGHYQPQEDTLALAKRAFAAYGFHVPEISVRPYKQW